MDSKTLQVLEYPKILARLANFCDFSASAEMAQALQPSPDCEEALARLAETTEARKLLASNDVTIGGAHDIREQVALAARGGVLDPKEMLDVQATLVSMRDLRRFFDKHSGDFPHLADLSTRLPAPTGLIEAISRCITDTGEVADSASPRLYDLRRQVRVAHDRLMTRLQRYLTEPSTASKLQDTVITQRDGRFVIPLRAEFKGQVKAIVHDQSSTGATLFIEPLAVVELNNAFREAQVAERDEVRRILTVLSGQVGELAGEIVPGVAALAELDLVFARAKYADEIGASEPILKKMPKAWAKTPKAPSGDGEQPALSDLPTVQLLKARHPLLDPDSVVSTTIDPQPGTFALVITGPNTGGKTVTLKTVGLFAAMAQSGLHIPAQSGSELPCFHAIYADIGDEQSIEQSLSTFSGHITNIVNILKKADRRSLVILDELGAGTDPQEGAALARAILQDLLSRGITTFVATHYPELKTFAHTTPGVVNASLEFNVQTLRPTYKLTIGLPGRSNALAIAQRLGLPGEIIEAAKSEINPQDLKADKLIGDIHRQRKIAFRESEKAERARSEARKLERQLEERLANIDQEREQVLEQARAEGQLEIEILKAQLKTFKEELRKARQPLEATEAVKDIEARVEDTEEKLHEKSRSRKKAPAKTANRPSRPLGVGDKVLLRSLGTPGTILSLDEDEAEVQAGALRMRVPLDQLRRRDEEEEPEEQTARPSGKRSLAEPQSSIRNQQSSIHAPSPGIELDLRGQRAEDALDMLDTYLEKAYLSGLPFVRIIHGKGTGKLRQEVRAMLKDHPHVLSFEEGGEKEGGAGVTVAKLVSG